MRIRARGQQRRPENSAPPAQLPVPGSGASALLHRLARWSWWRSSPRYSPPDPHSAVLSGKHRPDQRAAIAGTSTPETASTYSPLQTRGSRRYRLPPASLLAGARPSSDTTETPWVAISDPGKCVGAGPLAPDKVPPAGPVQPRSPRKPGIRSSAFYRLRGPASETDPTPDSSPARSPARGPEIRAAALVCDSPPGDGQLPRSRHARAPRVEFAAPHWPG